MNMDLLLGLFIGLPTGFLLFYAKEHKASMSYDLATVKADMVALHIKLDKLLNAISSHS